MNKTIFLIAWFFLAACSILGSVQDRRGDQAIRDGEWDEAVFAYQEALQEDPFNDELQNKFKMAKGQAAQMYHRRGRDYLQTGKPQLAIVEFKRALKLVPSGADHHAALSEALHYQEARALTDEAETLRLLGREDEAMALYQRAVERDPHLQKALEGITTLTENNQAMRRTSEFTQPITLRFRDAGLKEVFEGLSKAAGINFIFDKDVRNDPVTIFIQDAPFEEALRLILSSNNLFSARVGPTTLLVSPNTRQKQDQYQDQMVRTFYLSSAKAKDMVTLLKSMLDSKRMYANEQLNAVVLRDRPEKLQLAEKILLANDRRESEVVLDVEVLEVTRTKKQDYGVDFAKSARVGIIPQPGGTLTDTLLQTFSKSQLTDVGGANYLFQLPTEVVLDFLKTVTDTKTLASPKIRVVNNQKAEINIGDKEPILLSTTNVLPGNTTSAVPSTSTVTSIEFRDTGVKLAVEPSIRLVNELSLKLKIEFVRLGDKVVLQAAPLIEQFRFGNRTTETTLNMKDGETIVIAGLIQEEDRKTKRTIPWLGDLPGLGPFFTSYDTQRVTTEVVVTITPKIIHAMTPPGPARQAFWSGTEHFYSNKPLFSRSASHALNFRGYPVSTGKGQQKGHTLPRSLTPLNPSRRLEGAVALRVEPSDLAIKVGQEFQVHLTAENFSSFSGGGANLEFDSQILELKTIQEGTFLSDGSTKALLSLEPLSTEGTFKMLFTRQGAPASGNGELALVTFIAKAPGVSQVSFHMSKTGGGDNDTPTQLQGRAMVRVR